MNVKQILIALLVAITFLFQIQNQGLCQIQNDKVKESYRKEISDIVKTLQLDSDLMQVYSLLLNPATLDSKANAAVVQFLRDRYVDVPLSKKMPLRFHDKLPGLGATLFLFKGSVVGFMEEIKLTGGDSTLDEAIAFGAKYNETYPLPAVTACKTFSDMQRRVSLLSSKADQGFDSEKIKQFIEDATNVDLTNLINTILNATPPALP